MIMISDIRDTWSVVSTSETYKKAESIRSQSKRNLTKALRRRRVRRNVKRRKKTRVKETAEESVEEAMSLNIFL